MKCAIKGRLSSREVTMSRVKLINLLRQSSWNVSAEFFTSRILVVFIQETLALHDRGSTTRSRRGTARTSPRRGRSSTSSTGNDRRDAPSFSSGPTGTGHGSSVLQRYWRRWSVTLTSIDEQSSTMPSLRNIWFWSPPLKLSARWSYSALATIIACYPTKTLKAFGFLCRSPLAWLSTRSSFRVTTSRLNPIICSKSSVLRFHVIQSFAVIIKYSTSNRITDKILGPVAWLKWIMVNRLSNATWVIQVIGINAGLFVKFSWFFFPKLFWYCKENNKNKGRFVQLI